MAQRGRDARRRRNGHIQRRRQLSAESVGSMCEFNTCSSSTLTKSVSGFVFVHSRECAGADNQRLVDSRGLWGAAAERAGAGTEQGQRQLGMNDCNADSAFSLLKHAN